MNTEWLATVSGRGTTLYRNGDHREISYEN